MAITWLCLLSVRVALVIDDGRVLADSFRDEVLSGGTAKIATPISSSSGVAVSGSAVRLVVICDACKT